MLPTLSQYFSINSANIHPTCIACNQTDYGFHWLLCPNSNSFSNIIQNIITQYSFSDLPDLSLNELQQLRNNLLTHYCLSPTQSTPFNTTTFYTTIQGYIPKSLINIISQHTSYKNATNTIIKLLLLISQRIHEQLWKPYCINLAHWKSTQALPQPHTISTKPLYTSRYNRALYTYSCICGLPDQHENNNSTCPPLGLALRKIEIWSYNWIKYSFPTNSILHIQI